ncbi:N-acetylglucosamine kinase [Glutamicibacter ardleyensis]|uniref:ATPase, BadF/BadG/BcrA/BcrD type n=1 Tax=Glutamicibacter ardleyensis TaxID=225894 RepID=A0ABQ2DD01_9MICC|nr:BadF/BadG/BcrA/BcrD ATPase family protein [Glutamicibacter ardleyensis]GGJ53553.1 ATPase, BadF/BadG/BcrA/BcrD type [Glutamicibacter ardleyensis]
MESTNSSKPVPLRLIALDIGGTKTHAVRYLGNQVVAEVRTGSANVQNVSIDEAQQALCDAFAGLGEQPVDLVIAGAGGIDTDADSLVLRKLIEPFVPKVEVQVVHDTRLILAAGQTHAGVAVILGTGSAIWGLNSSGQTARYGGWGYLLGDEAAGYWFGREAVRHALDEFNRGQAKSALTASLLEHTECATPEDLIAFFHKQSSREYWARCAPVIFEAIRSGDAAAEEILQRAISFVVSKVGVVAGQLGISGPIVLGGGVIEHQLIYQERLRRALAAEGFEDLRFLARSPVHGAAFLAGLTDDV